MKTRAMLAVPVLLNAACVWAAFGMDEDRGAGSMAGNLVHNGDFEIVSSDCPPSGWTMWGAQKYKNPANYTRDETAAHRGKASFRIYHPGNTSGYVVSAPEHAIRPRAGKVYSVSFCARSDRNGSSTFGFTAYESVRPFVDAPSPGRWPIEVTGSWQRFQFEICEGWDFFADRSRFLLLTFYPTQDNKEECTLWVDDVVVTEATSPRDGRLLDASRLTYEPLQHRLAPGDRLEFTVDARQRLGAAAQNVGAVSFHRVAGWTGHPYNKAGEYTLPAETERAIREMRMPMTRFYAVGDEPFSLEESIDRVAEVCRRVNVPLDHCVLELETQGARTKLAPEVWARGVSHARKEDYGFRYWEISNEPYLMRPGTAFPTPESYVEHVKDVSRAIRAVDPQAQVGIGIHKNSQKWGNYILKRTAGCYDFVAAHHYASVRSVHTCMFEAAVLAANYKALDGCLRVNALMRAYNPGREVVQIDTEWGMHCGGPNGERADYVDRNANIFGTVHRAVRLIYYAREGMLAGASAWQMLNRVGAQGFGALGPEVPEKRFMLYWLYYYFNRHLGEWALELHGTAPYYVPSARDAPSFKEGEYGGPQTPVLATLSKDGSALYVVIANGSWAKAAPCRIEVRNFPISQAHGILLTHSDPDGKPLLERKEDADSSLPVAMGNDVLTCAIPPHAVANAVYMFLEEYLDIHWPEPGQESVPKTKDPKFDGIELISNPAFADRGMSPLWRDEVVATQVVDWLAKNRLNGFQSGIRTWPSKLLPDIRKRGLSPNVGHHSRYYFFPSNWNYFRDHPTYFALVDGKRVTNTQICYSNLDSIPDYAANVIAYVKAHPEIKKIDLWPTDGFGFCECQECQAKPDTDVILNYTNRLSVLINNELPDLKFEFLAYIHYKTPSTSVRPLPNVVPVYCEYWSRNQFHPITDDLNKNKQCRAELEAWIALSNEVTVYGYYGDDVIKKCLYNPLMDVIVADFRHYKKIGLNGQYVLVTNPEQWWSNSPHLYACAKALWDPQVKLERIEREYYESLYGPAAQPMQEHAQACRALFELETAQGTTGHSFLFGGRFGKYDESKDAETRAQVADAVGRIRSCLARARASNPRQHVLDRIAILESDAEYVYSLLKITYEEQKAIAKDSKELRDKAADLARKALELDVVRNCRSPKEQLNRILERLVDSEKK